MRLRFQVGEVELFARRLDVAVQTRCCDELGTDPDATLPPHPGAAANPVAAYVVFSHPLEKRIPVLAIRDHFIRYASHQYRRGYVRVEGGFDQYLARMPGSRRSKLRRKAKKLFSQFPDAQLVEYADAESMAEFHDRALTISRASYQERLFSKGLPSDEAFLGDMIARTAGPIKRARGYLLVSRDKPLAYLYAWANDGVMTVEYIGYDAAYREWSPGNVLQLLVLERIFGERTCHTFDYGEGESQYKDCFSTHATMCADIYYFHRDVRGMALAGVQAGLFFASRATVRLADRLGIKSELKRLLRRAGRASAADREG